MFLIANSEPYLMQNGCCFVNYGPILNEIHNEVGNIWGVANL